MLRRVLFGVITFGFISSAMAQPQAAPAYQSAGTKKMAALLEKIYRETDWRGDPNKPAERLPYYKNLLASGQLSPQQRVAVQLELANELLRAGESASAVDTLEGLARLVRDQKLALPREAETQLHSELAISYLRLGEQQNCQDMHGAKSCIFPIGKGGVHSNPRGAEGAVREYAWLVEHDPHDASAQWLLNIAYMQLGRYPDGVPAKWLIPASRFQSEYTIGEFPDVAPQAGFNFMQRSGGVLVEDFDGDGLLDVMVSSSGPLDQMRFFHNNGDGTFSDRTRQAGLMGEVGGLNLVLTDYNNDGHPDVLVLRGGWWNRFGHYPLSLLKNNGDGTFDDVTEQAGLLTLAPTQTAAWADYDNDGWLDLFVGYESNPGDAHASKLFHNNHDGTFTEVGATSGLGDLGFVKGVAWGDYNNDGRPDLYVSVKGAANHLFRNDGPRDPRNPAAGWKFTDVTARAGVAAPRESFATWFFDYDNDGWPDIFVAGYSMDSVNDVGLFEMGKPYKAEVPRLFHNNRDGTFTDVTANAHLDRAILTMGANFGDLDNDGWLDIYLGNGEPAYEALLPNRMFRNDRGHVFQDVTTSGGFGNLQKGHAVAFADFENNGNEDVFEEMGGAFPGDTYQSTLYRNPGHGNHWITLALDGVQTNRAAFGARIMVEFRENGGVRRVYRTVGYGSSFGGNPLRQHIGLGKAMSIVKAEIFWPVTGKTQVLSGLEVDHAYRIREGAARAEPVHWKRYSFATIPETKDAVGMQH